MFLLCRFCKCNQTPFQEERCIPDRIPHPSCEVAQAMSNIFGSKILNTTLLGYSRKKSTHPQIMDGKIFLPLSRSLLPTFPGLLQYGDPFLARFLQSCFGSPFNLWSTNGQHIKSYAADIFCVPPCIGLILHKYDEIMI